MENKSLPQQSPFNKRQDKGTTLVINFIKSKVENDTGLSLKELKEKYPEEQLFYVALKHITTTKKAICSAMEIPIEAGCRYKRNYEKLGLLKQSTNDVICPYTKHFAKLISTDPNEFEKLTNTNQLMLMLF